MEIDLAMTAPSTSSEKLSVCIVSHNAYGMISGKAYDKEAKGASGPIGGIEWQTTLLARWLARQQHRVTMLTWDEGGPVEESFDGVRVQKICRSDDGVRGLRFFHPKWTALVKALRRADADVYLQNGSEYVTGQVALWCRRRGKPFVFSTASDMDCEWNPPEMDSGLERVLYRYGVRHADRRIAQTEVQRERLSANLGCEAVTIPMPCPGPAACEPRQNPPAGRFRVLWVAGIRRVKRPDRYLELARACPEFDFDLVGPFYEEDYARGIRQAAAGVPNVTVHGGVPREKLGQYYRAAGCLCCTSDKEGFPNTFLEAWSHALPIISTFDPDRLIQRRGMGIFATDVPGLSAALRRLATEPETYARMAAEARRHYEENHTLEAVMPRVERVLQEAVAARRNGGKG